MYDVYWLARWLFMWGFVGSKHLKYNSNIRTENNTEYTNNRTLKNGTEQIEQKQNRNEWKTNNWWTRTENGNIKNKWINTDSMNIHNWRLNSDHLILTRVKYLCDYGTDNCKLFAWVLIMASVSCCWFLCFSSGLTSGLLKNHRTSQQLYCYIQYLTLQYRTSWIP